MLESLQGLIGIGLIYAIAWGLSENKRRMPWRLIGVGLLVQAALACLLLWAPPVQQFFLLLNQAVQALATATKAGTSFVFGYLGGGPAPFEAKDPGNLFILAFEALPIILLIAALSALLWHWNILRWLVKGFTWALRRTIGVGGPAGVAATSNIFVGMVEAPMLIRPVFKQLTHADLFLVMTAGMATIAGSVMVLYAQILSPVMPGALGHILTSSVLSIPGSAIIARIMVPPDSATSPDDERIPMTDYAGAMDAVTRGTGDGLRTILNVVAMLLVLVALVALVNSILNLLPDLAGGALTLERILGWLFSPLAWAIGIPWEEAGTAGALLGTKTVLNELIAYLHYADLPAEALSEKSRLILVYALCGFANMGSLGIMIGGFGTLAPERQAEVVGLGARAVIAGTLTTCLNGALVGIISGL